LAIPTVKESAGDRQIKSPARWAASPPAHGVTPASSGKTQNGVRAVLRVQGRALPSTAQVI
jgi:hypothetical protein